MLNTIWYDTETPLNKACHPLFVNQIVIQAHPGSSRGLGTGMELDNIGHAGGPDSSVTVAAVHKSDLA